MLSKNDLLDYRTFGDYYQIEKDYLQDLILHEIYSKSKEDFVFKGGTALSKFYYSDRFSEDLDFTLRKPAGHEISKYVESLLSGIVSGFVYKTIYRGKPKMNNFGTIETALLIEGPRFTGKQSTLQSIRLEIGTKSSLMLKPLALPRAPIYADAANYVALVMDKTEILAEKFRALLSKGRFHKERDLYDIYFLLSKETSINRKIVYAKLAESGIKFSQKELLDTIGRIHETWEALRPMVKHNLEKYDYVKDFVNERIEKARL